MKNTEIPFLPQGLFTSCPNCMKQFHIQAAQLSMASGRVECGSCGHRFSALSRLSDIPLVLDEAVRDGRVQPGHLVASSGFGAGLSWGAALFRWQGPA